MFQIAPCDFDLTSRHGGFKNDLHDRLIGLFRLDHFRHPKMLFLVRGLDCSPFAKQKLFWMNVIFGSDRFTFQW